MHSKPAATIKFSESDDGLTKFLPKDVMKGNFGNLIDYVATPGEDELNPEYEENEKIKAGRLSHWMGDMRGGNGEIDLRCFDENNQLSEPIGLELNVRDHYPSMLRRNTAMTENGPQEYDGIDFLVQYHPIGGK